MGVASDFGAAESQASGRGEGRRCLSSNPQSGGLRVGEFGGRSVRRWRRG